MRIRSPNRSSPATPAWLAVTVALLALLVSPLAGRADHDAADQAWRVPLLAACATAWTPIDPNTSRTAGGELRPVRVVTYDGRSLHGEPAHVGALFWNTWQARRLATPGQPTPAELELGVHLQRWVWEYECTHPRPDSPEVNDDSVGSGDSVDRVAASAQPPYFNAQLSAWRDQCGRLAHAFLTAWHAGDVAGVRAAGDRMYAFNRDGIHPAGRGRCGAQPNAPGPPYQHGEAWTYEPPGGPD